MSDNSDYQPPIPAAVRRAAARAEELAREQGAVNVPPPDPEAGVAVSPVEGADGGDGGSATPPSPPEAAQSSETQSEDHGWRQRFSTLQGKYDSEVPALYNQIRSLQNVLAAMQAAEAVPQSQPATLAEITPEDRETYGEELIQNVAKWASVGLRPQISQLEAENRRLATELAQLREGQGQQSQTLVQHNVMSQLDMDPELAGRWRSLNEDPGYNNWLAEIDPYSGQQRVVLLRDAFARGDAVRTGRFFKAYMSEHTAPSVGRAAPAHTQSVNGRAGQMTLDQLAAPGRAAAAGTSSGASPERRMWTNREIGAFYRDVQRGVFNGREADKNRIEQDIVTAASEGRVMS